METKFSDYIDLPQIVQLTGEFLDMQMWNEKVIHHELNDYEYVISRVKQPQGLHPRYEAAVNQILTECWLQTKKEMHFDESHLNYDNVTMVLKRYYQNINKAIHKYRDLAYQRRELHA